jgi:hypothetical protein
MARSAPPTLRNGARWHSGAGMPADTLGLDGDLYHRTANGDVYLKSGGAWGSAYANIKGADGADGSNGLDGADGDTIGFQTICFGPGGFLPAMTNGMASADVETSTNTRNFVVLDADGAADASAHVTIAFPKGWDRGGIRFRVFWTTDHAGTDGTAFALRGVALSDGEALDAAAGAPVIVADDAQGGAGKLLVTAISGDVTLAGTPAEGDLCLLELFRDVSDAADTMTQDARILAVQLLYKINAGNDD